MNYIVDRGSWDSDVVFTEHSYSNSTAFDCVILCIIIYPSKTF